jgi:hypothetical protein
MRPTGLIVAIALVAATAYPLAAECAERRNYFCVPIVFKKADPGLKKKPGAFANHCSGFIEFKGQTATAVFQDPGPCPKNDTALTGHLVTLCQDNGEWADADWWFANRPAFCRMSHDDRRREATVLASQIRPGMTHDAVRKILKGYEYIGAGFAAQFSEQYYGHPNTVIEVPYDNPVGERKVADRPIVADMDMPQP